MSEPNPRSELPSPPSRPLSHPGTAGGVPAQETRGLEQGRRLQATALEVALLGDRRVESVLALRELAPRQSDRGRGQQLDRRALRRRRQAVRRRGRRAGHRWRWRAPAPRRRPRSGARGAAARRRGRRRGPASPCGRARPRSPLRTEAAPPPGPAQSRTSIGRRRLPPAASVAAASAPSGLAVTAALLAQHRPRPRPSGPAASGSRHRGPPLPEAGRPRAGSPGDAGCGSSTIPPARTVYRIPSRPARSIISARPCGAGKLTAPTPPGRRRPRGRQRSCPAGARCGRTRANRRSRTAARRGLRELEHDQPPPRAQHPRHLLQAPEAIGEVADAEADRGGVEASRVIRKAERIGPLEADRAGASGRGLVPRQVEHRLGEVTADDMATWRNPPGQLAERNRRSRSRRPAPSRPGAARRGRRPARASDGAGRRSSASSAGHSARQPDRTCG